MPSPSSLPVSPSLLAFSLVLAASAGVFALLHRTRPEPFMDEVFHVPQAQKYCMGKFKEVRIGLLVHFASV